MFAPAFASVDVDDALEVVALLIMLRDILPVRGPGRVLHLFIDNTAVVYSVRKQRSKSLPAFRIVEQATKIAEACESLVRERCFS
eukprot:COSAG02_NODE_29_length_51136_cov_346.293317_26_plen_85_part_00